ncbi:hypothetical protein BC826DRAFT_1110516 [Russula brevipes]|nr:hypothetical protein BC826DRAFT_1110516 [Russula brevipes]
MTVHEAPSSASAHPSAPPTTTGAGEALHALLSSALAGTPVSLTTVERGTRLAGMASYRGVYDTSLWFLDGPAEFWALADLAPGEAGVRLRSPWMLMRSVVLVRRSGDGEGEEETVFDMIARKEMEGIPECGDTAARSGSRLKSNKTRRVQRRAPQPMWRHQRGRGRRRRRPDGPTEAGDFRISTAGKDEARSEGESLTRNTIDTPRCCAQVRFPRCLAPRWTPRSGSSWRALSGRVSNVGPPGPPVVARDEQSHEDEEGDEEEEDELAD